MMSKMTVRIMNANTVFTSRVDSQNGTCTVLIVKLVLVVVVFMCIVAIAVTG